MEQTRATSPCKNCGDSPHIHQEQDGFWYVVCTIECSLNHDTHSEWDRLESRAIEKWNSVHSSGSLNAEADRTDWTRKLVIAVGECIADQRNGMDVLASASWDRVCELWCEEERQKGTG